MIHSVAIMKSGLTGNLIAIYTMGNLPFSTEKQAARILTRAEMLMGIHAQVNMIGILSIAGNTILMSLTLETSVVFAEGGLLMTTLWRQSTTSLHLHFNSASNLRMEQRECKHR